MEKSAKKLYECPAIQIVVVKTEGIVCVSGERSSYEGFDVD